MFGCKPKVHSARVVRLHHSPPKGVNMSLINELREKVIREIGIPKKIKKNYTCIIKNGKVYISKRRGSQVV